MIELVPSSTQILVDLFQGPLRDVRFPDADAERLEAVIEAVKTANAAVARAEAEALAAREALADKQRFLAHETERTLAYVRVYASDRPDLRAVIDGAVAPKPAARRGPGRPKKAATAVTNPEEAADAAAAE